MAVSQEAPLVIAPTPPFSMDRARAPRVWSIVRDGRVARFVICLAIFAFLALWVRLWPHTMDGDSILHYFTARDAFKDPANLMSAWARWGSKLPILIPAQFGVAPARLTMALLSTVLAWQTMRLADDLEVPNAWLAGPLLILQPLVFAVAADTMTEMPMALALVIAIRLWFAKRYAASCLLVSFLPTIRPEGFFFIAMWGGMTLLTWRSGPWKRAILSLALLGVGMLVWMLLSWILAHDPLYFRTNWNWPADSYPAYGRGSFFHHFVRWPVYCGPVLFVLFLAGIRPSLRPKMALPWAAWWLVIGIHTILFWRGWFASCGLMRIMAQSSPVTAVICLFGWNAIGERLRPRFSFTARRFLGGAALAAALATVIFYYDDIPEHHRCFPLIRAAAYARDQRLLDGAPRFFAGDPVAVAEMNLPPRAAILWNQHSCVRAEEYARLSALPVGTVGIWDNQHAQDWFTISLEDLHDLGFTVLHEEHASFHTRLMGLKWNGNPNMVYVVVRKERQGDTR